MLHSPLLAVKHPDACQPSAAAVASILQGSALSPECRSQAFHSTLTIMAALRQIHASAYLATRMLLRLATQQQLWSAHKEAVLLILEAHGLPRLRCKPVLCACLMLRSVQLQRSKNWATSSMCALIRTSQCVIHALEETLWYLKKHACDLRIPLRAASNLLVGLQRDAANYLRHAGCVAAS